MRLSSGLRCVLRQPRLPGIRRYYVVALLAGGVTARDRDELYLLAHRVGRMMARGRYGDPECYSLVYNAARTSRSPWPHVHVLVNRSVAEKRRTMFFFHLKHVLRWRRWLRFRWVWRLA